MSETKLWPDYASIRGSVPEGARRAYDAYETPRWVVDRTLAGIALLRGDPPRILDVGAGAGIWGEGARARWPHAAITGIEIREMPHPEAYDVWMGGDFHHRIGEVSRFNLIMGNPPYNQAESMIEAGLSHLHSGGVLVFLLRLSFLEGIGRKRGLFHENPPSVVRVCSKRPSFDNNGKTNATAFAAFYFGYPRDERGGPEIDWMEEDD